MKVTLLDSMGDDLTVVNSARVSFNKVSEEYKEQDERLISYLATHNHWTPFSHVQYQVRIKAPIFISRQWFKHQIGITRNEVSRRYVSDSPTFFTPPSWRMRPDNMKQGSEGRLPLEKEAVWDQSIIDHHNACLNLYRDMMADGVCPEQARMVLPQSMYTEWVETGSLVAAARIAKQRLDSHAQAEIQVLAQLYADAVKDIAPNSWRVLT